VRLTIVTFASGGRRRPFKARRAQEGFRSFGGVASPAIRFSKEPVRVRERLVHPTSRPSHTFIQSVEGVDARQEVSGSISLGKIHDRTDADVGVAMP